MGTVTLLFTDIEGSTALARSLGDGWAPVLEHHHRIVGGAIEDHHGWIEGTEGDAFFAVFDEPHHAVAAAAAAQHDLAAHGWPAACGAVGVRVRMGLHTGFVERHPTGYVGLEVHRAARVGAAANGGQVLLTEATHQLVPAVEVDDLGLHRLKDFPAAEQLYSLVVDGTHAGAFPAPRTLSVRPTNLPAEERPLLGRHADLSKVIAALVHDRARLVTVTGLGGVGKSRLGVAAGAALLDHFAGGVWHVPLATVGAAAAIPELVAAAVGVVDPGGGSIHEALANRLGSRPTLLVLDNLEHLVGAGAVVAALLDASPVVQVLATSQAPLRLRAEQVLPLASLEQVPARALFLATAARSRPGFAPSDEELAAIDAICERLDHLPLAIELAAARLSVLSPAELDARLARSFELVRAPDPDRPERHRSLRAALEWTLGQLDPLARSLFGRLGTFAGAVSLEDIETVCGSDGLDVIDAAATLVDVGILRRRDDGRGASRFVLPEAVRQLAVEELDARSDGASWRGGHAAHVLGILVEAAVGTSTAARWVRALDQEAEIRRSLEWARAHDPVLAAELGATWAAILTDCGRCREALDLASAALAVDGIGIRTRVCALGSIGHVHLVLNQGPEAVEVLRSALDLTELDDPLRVCLLVQLGLGVGFVGGDVVGWARANGEALDLARASGRPAAVAFALAFHAQELTMSRRFDEAEVALDEASTLAEASGAKASWYLATLRADLALGRGDGATAAASYLRSLQDARQRGDQLQAHFDLHGLAGSLACAGHDPAALEVYGIARSNAADLGRDLGAVEVWDEVPFHEHLSAARARLGQAGDALIAAGSACAPGLRLARARELVAEVTPIASGR